MIAHDLVGKQYPVPSPSEAAITFTASILLSGRYAKTPMIIKINKDLFNNLAIAQGFEKADTHHWKSISSPMEFDFENTKRPVIRPIFCPNVPYLNTFNPEMTLNAPTKEFWSLMNGLTSVKGLRKAFHIQYERKPLVSKVSIPAIFISDDIPHILSIKLLETIAPIVPDAEENVKFLYYILGQLRLESSMQFGIASTNKALSTLLPDGRRHHRLIGRTVPLRTVLMDVLSTGSFASHFRLSSLRAPLAYSSTICSLNHFALVEGLSFWSYILTGRNVSSWLNLSTITNYSPAEIRVERRFYNKIFSFLEQTPKSIEKRLDEVQLTKLHDIIVKFTEAEEVEDRDVERTARTVVQCYKEYMTKKIFVSSPLLPTQIQKKLRDASRLRDVMTIFLLRFFYPGYGTISYFSRQKKAAGISKSEDPHWSSEDCLITDSQSVLQVIFTSLPTILAAKLLPWFEEFYHEGEQLTEARMLQERINLTDMLNRLYLRLYISLMNGIQGLARDDMAEIIPAIDILHQDNIEPSQQSSALLILLRTLPDLKGFLWAIHVIGLGSRSWTLNHFAVTEDKIERDDRIYNKVWIQMEKILRIPKNPSSEEVDLIQGLKDTLKNPILEFQQRLNQRPQDDSINLDIPDVMKVKNAVYSSDTTISNLLLYGKIELLE